MTAKQYLKQLQKIRLNIDILMEEIERQRTRLTSTTIAPTGDRVQTSPNGDKFADAMARLADQELQYEDMLYAYEESRNRIVRQILGLDDAAQGHILYARYVQGKRWEVIADEMHYAREHVCRIHGRALVAFYEKYSDTWE